MGTRVSADIGGTFTDVVVSEPDGMQTAAKAMTTPRDLTDGVFAALDAAGADAADINYFVHGTTQGLNALLQRHGVPVLLLATAGAVDVYQIARGNRERLFDAHFRKRPGLVRRSATVEIEGRLDHTGTEVTALDEDAVRAAARQFRDEEFGAIAVGFLFAHLNPAHERRAAALLREELGADVPISLSSDVAREWREYERTASTVVESYTAPVVRQYLARLETECRDRGLERPVHVMQSSGGTITAATARQHPLQTLLSGPVGGTMGGVALSRELNRSNLIVMDMGGTSFDVSLVVDGRPDVNTEARLEGHPLLMPVVSIHTIGAGGGSRVHVEGGGLRVGPESAGAVPGPACYGRGGTEPTVTDADCLLGRVDPDWFAGGRVHLDVDAARGALDHVATHLGMDATTLAEGACDVVHAQMSQAIRTLTVEQGVEPAEFTLVAAGGAGPMHAAFLAEELGISEVVVPRWPGTFSAWGMLETDIRTDLTAPHFVAGADLDGAAMTAALRKLHDEADHALSDEDVDVSRRRIEHAVDVRYSGQQYTLTIPLSTLEEPTEEGFAERMVDRFSAAHRKRYGHANAGSGIEFVTLRTTAFGVLDRPEPPSATGATEPVPEEYRTAFFDRREQRTRVLRRADLPARHEIDGPSLVLEETATTVVPPGFRCTHHDHGALLLRPGGHA